MKSNNSNIDPSSVKKWITIIIAILSAIAGAITENASGFVGNLF